MSRIAVSEMASSEESRARALLQGLTAKQVEVLDLLIMHRTTKEIARELSIAPNTVDQRINGVRDKWGTLNRKDTARRYAHLIELCGKTTWGISRVDGGPDYADDSGQDLPVDPVFVLSDAGFSPHPDWFDDLGAAPTGLEAFDARFGKLGRVGAIFVLALILAMTLASSLAIAEALGKLFRS